MAAALEEEKRAMVEKVRACKVRRSSPVTVLRSDEFALQYLSHVASLLVLLVAGQGEANTDMWRYHQDGGGH